MVPSTISTLALLGALTTAASIPAAHESSVLTVPLNQHLPTTARTSLSVARSSIHAAQKHTSYFSTSSASASAVGTPDTLDSGFWYGTFSVGAGTNLSLLIDTGSSDTAVNPDKYHAGKSSVNKRRSGHLRYSTTQENGCGNGDMTYDVYTDSVSLAGLTVPAQTLAWVQKTTPPDSGTITQFPHDGLVGFGSAAQSSLGATPFFNSLCSNKAVAACRFGLAFRMDGTGSQVLGSVDTSLFNGSLTTTSVSSPWTVKGDVVVGGTVIAKSQSILLDSGTANIIGPPAAVKKLFNAAGIKYQTLDLPGCAEVVTGSYPCGNAPTNVGFAFPSGNGKSFNIEAKAFEEAKDDNGDGNCTATVTGIDFGSNFWIVGQSWMQGKYVDFNFDGNSIGIATLKQK